MFCRLLIVAAFLASPITASAEPATQGARWLYRGAGTDSCGKFIGAMHGNPPGRGMAIKDLEGKEYFDQSNLYAQWLQGFLTGINVMDSTGSKQIAIDYPGVELWISNWCKENPANSLVEAAGAFVRWQRQSFEAR